MIKEIFFDAEQNRQAKNIIFLIIGTIIYSFYAGILIPSNELGTGGALGLAFVVNKIFGMKIGTAQFILNVPLFYLGYKHIGRRFTALTGIIIALSSLLINYLPLVITPVNLNDKLVAAVFAGIMSGVALSFLLIAGGSTGGSDITGKYLANKYNISVPTIFLIQDIIIYIIIWTAFDIKYVMYALVMSFVRNQTLKGIQKLISAYIQCTIITKNPKQLVDVINSELNRGSTIIDVEGGYTNQKLQMIILVIQQNEMLKLKKLVKENCPDAFITVNSISAIMGNFKEHSYRL